MSPVEQAAAVYQREECPRTFAEDLELHLLHGLVHSTPTAFVLARYVCRDWPRELIVTPDGRTSVQPPDCLHIYLAAGDIAEFFTFPHRHAKWVSFERQNILRFWPYDRIRRLCTTNRISPAHTGIRA